MATVDEKVGANADDGQRYTGTGGFSATATNPYLGYRLGAASLACQGFYRFTTIAVAAGSIISKAYLQLRSFTSGNANGLAKWTIYGVDEDSAAAPTSAAEFDADPLTSASADWDEAFESDDTWYTSPDLKTVVQEIVSRGGWATGQNMMFQIKNDGLTTAHGYNSVFNHNGDAAKAAKLHIEYQAAVTKAPVFVHTQRQQGG